jgi:hypothetical protein
MIVTGMRRCPTGCAAVFERFHNQFHRPTHGKLLVIVAGCTTTSTATT